MTDETIFTDAMIDAFIHAQSTAAGPRRELTSQQRVIVRLMEGSIRMLERGTVAEQQTAALLRLCADAIERDYDAGLVAVGREWRAAWERGQVSETLCKEAGE